MALNLLQRLGVIALIVTELLMHHMHLHLQNIESDQITTT